MLFNKHSVGGLEIERRTVLDQALEIQFDPLLSGGSGPDDNHAIPPGKLGESAGARDPIEDRHSLFDKENIRPAHFTENGNLQTVDFLDDDTDEWICDEFKQLGRNLRL